MVYRIQSPKKETKQNKKDKKENKIVTDISPSKWEEVGLLLNTSNVVGFNRIYLVLPFFF